LPDETWLELINRLLDFVTSEAQNSGQSKSEMLQIKKVSANSNDNADSNDSNDNAVAVKAQEEDNKNK
jgi:negative regulator of replication initiation